jgi:hypothetical protein
VVLLLHGTATVHLQSIAAKGLNAPYLTSSVETADYYAECCAEQGNGEPVVLAVRARCVHLAVDVQALEEPVFADAALRALYSERAQRDGCSIEQALWNAADRACASEHVHSWTGLSWRASVALVGCCRLRCDVEAAPVPCSQ